MRRYYLYHLSPCQFLSLRVPAFIRAWDIGGQFPYFADGAQGEPGYREEPAQGEACEIWMAQPPVPPDVGQVWLPSGV